MQTRRLNGTALQVIRELAGLRHGQLAKRAEVDPGYLTKLENGARQPSPAVMRRLADSLGVSLEAISYPVITQEAA
ncbi:helix-turn-helix transcriptional regulator [Curtobacterium sp. MCSS17_015]|jgi:transcriptional regulator with XRE-family HTH domain|uniref:helix-turn-helix domain-containing protein n=1 Tax=Curtobacterium sp. MCSS17_015 TaxID=2175666 RepID=UPI000DA96E50|nr:helix-turn-helix transcriptional regulator [Curtobacterium sp. MCSS17_015]WIB25401.1 helix-turn-helix transcriptional regulator [Curtobacterium sp. MCSS17_015]